MGYLKPKKAKKRLTDRVVAYDALMSKLPANQRGGYTKPGSKKSV